MGANSDELCSRPLLFNPTLKASNHPGQRFLVFTTTQPFAGEKLKFGSAFVDRLPGAAALVTSFARTTEHQSLVRLPHKLSLPEVLSVH
ncbi:hypothetical protein TNCV_3455521 [Trichonephila clavipes]|nr:hypothetical protein TNCV_3455521 [Trichonephila clavipes]